MEKEKVNCVQIVSILVFIITAPLTGINVTYTLNTAGVDAYFCPLIAALIGLPLLFVFITIFNFKPDLTLGEKVIYIFGKKVGKIINILLMMFAIFFSITLFFNLTDFIVSQFLPETPTKFIGFFFGLIIIYVVTKGIETISRVSLILLFFTTIIFIISMYGLISYFDINNLKPFLEFGLSSTFKGSIHLLCVNFFPLFLLLTIPKNQITDNKHFHKWLIGAYIFSTVLMFLIVFAIISNLGINLATIYQYPEYLILKRINLFNFLDRIENILSMQRIMKMFMFLCFCTFFVANTIKAHNKSKILPIIIVLIIYLISENVFKNNTMFNRFLLKYVSLFRLLFLGLILFIFIFLIIKKLTKKINT